MAATGFAAIGGSNSDWLGNSGVGGIAYLFSFGGQVSAGGFDTPVFVFAETQGNGEKAVAETISHEVGHSLGLSHWGEVIPGQAKPSDYYSGHGPSVPATTGWGPIMGAPFSKELSQWSHGEYPNAITVTDPLTLNLQDDLDAITTNFLGWWDGELATTESGFDRFDDLGNPLPDYGDDIAHAFPLGTTDTGYFSEGLIGDRNDVDDFSFAVEDAEEVTINIDPAAIGPNLDILANLYVYDSSGNPVVLATSNPHDALNASFTINTLTKTISYLDVDGTLKSITPPDTDDVVPGNFYVSVDGTGKSASVSDAGYSDYGSLGYYTITGTRQVFVVGIDFDQEGGLAPLNWNQYTGGGTSIVLGDPDPANDPQDLIPSLINEAGLDVPYTLTMSSNGSAFQTHPSSNPINPADLPSHASDLSALDGYMASASDTWTFTWGNLTPNSAYQIYVFGHADAVSRNVVTVTGGQWLGEQQQTYNFTQNVTADSLFVNSTEGNGVLTSSALLVVADTNGHITITVHGAGGFQSALAGLAIASTKVGSISGQKWNDNVDGDQRPGTIPTDSENEPDCPAGRFISTRTTTVSLIRPRIGQLQRPRATSFRCRSPMGISTELRAG